MDPVEESRRSLAEELAVWGRLVKFSHTIFALPFALSMFVIVARWRPVTFAQLGWILLSLAGARTAAMAFNRLIDRRIDAQNPRTKSRELPAGVVSTTSVAVLVAASSGVFLASASMLGTHCLVLAPFVLAWLLFYSWTKRFTRYAHLVLGLSLALAPGGVWYALTAEFAVLPLSMMGGVALWVAGFDIIYSCQDVEFDAANGLHSIPARVGVKRALLIARMLHAAAFVLLGVFGWYAGLGLAYFIGLGAFGGIIAGQHYLVSAEDLSRVDAAFFTRNGIASVAYFVAVLADSLLGNALG
jgi:4-hydroxybenzoate polyprenyltransferase